AIRFMPKPEVIIMLVVLVLSSVWDLVYAVGIGLVIASLMFMKKIGDLTDERSDVKSLEEEENWSDEGEFPISMQEQVFIKHIKGPLFFGSTSDFQGRMKMIPENASIVIVRMGRMAYIDQSGVYALEDEIIELRGANIQVLFVDVLKQPKYLLERTGIIPELVAQDHIFDTFDECLVWLEKNAKDYIT
ncbi:MAG: SulP family sulfate permease, partial [Flavobacteriaceae bacterium]